MEESGVDKPIEGVVRKLAGGAFPVQVTAKTMNRTPPIIARDFITTTITILFRLSPDDVHLVERSAKSARQLLPIIVGPEVHEEKSRVFIQHVTMQRRYFNTIIA